MVRNECDKSRECKLPLQQPLSQIDTRLLGVQGIIDVQGTTLNGERNNLELGEYEVPVLGGVGA